MGKSTQLAKMNRTQGRKAFQISAKGSLVIRDCTDDGTCLTIENTATKVLSHVAELSQKSSHL